MLKSPYITYKLCDMDLENMHNFTCAVYINNFFAFYFIRCCVLIESFLNVNTSENVKIKL